LQRYSLGISRVLAPVREVVPRAVEGLRDRDRVFRARAGIGIGGGRDADALLRAPGGIDFEAQHLARWLANSAHDRRPLPFGAAAARRGARPARALRRRGVAEAR